MAWPESVPVLRSVPTAEGIADLVRRAYRLDVRSCVLVRSFVNDVWKLEDSAQGRWVLKLYRHDGWTAEEVAWEIDLVNHLFTSGVPVAPARSMVGGETVGEVSAPEGVRPFALWECVEGSKPQLPFTDDLYHSHGRLIAQVHTAADSFRSDHQRRPSGLQGGLDESLARLDAALVDQPDSRRLVTDVGAAVQAWLDDHGSKLDQGPRHGDASMDNVHLTDSGLVIYDFDLAHVGLRIRDLSGCLSTPFGEAFLAGYVDVRPLGVTDRDALPWARAIEVLQNLDFHLTQKPLWLGSETIAEGWVRQGLADLHVAAERLI